MPVHNFDEDLSVALRSSMLTVNGHKLWADVLDPSDKEKIPISPTDLERVILFGRKIVLRDINALHQEQIKVDPTAKITQPFIRAAQLGSDAHVDSELLFTRHKPDKISVVDKPEYIQEPFHPYWDAIIKTGFLPEVRKASGADAGAWIVLRKPLLTEVLEHWFGFTGSLDNVIAHLKKVEGRERSDALRGYRISQEGIVDQTFDSDRPKAQVGLILSMAAIKAALGNRDGYSDELKSAFLYADNDPSIDTSTVRAMENSTFIESDL